MHVCRRAVGRGLSLAPPFNGLREEEPKLKECLCHQKTSSARRNINRVNPVWKRT